MSTSITDYTLHDKDGKSYVLSSVFFLIDNALAFMRLVLYGKDTFFRSVRSFGGNRPEVTELGRHCSALPDYFVLYSGQASFHPALAFFFEQYRLLRAKSIERSALERPGTVRSRAEDFDAFVGSMRKHALETGLKKDISDWESKVKKNLKRVLNFEKKIFRRCGRLLVIRLDLQYHAATFSREEILQFLGDVSRDRIAELERFEQGSKAEPFVMEGRIAFEEVHRDRKHLFANMKGKPSLFEHLVGYVWRIEWTPMAGYHLHAVLLFNGFKVDKDGCLAHDIGNYWTNEITGGRGRFHDCNKAWNSSSPTRALGIVSRDDAPKRQLLRHHLLPYLCKDSQSIQMMPFKGCNLFAVGFVHRDTSNGHRRPPAKGTDRGSAQGK